MTERHTIPFKKLLEAQENIKRLHARDQEERDRRLLEAIGERATDRDERDIWEYGFRQARLKR